VGQATYGLVAATVKSIADEALHPQRTVAIRPDDLDDDGPYDDYESTSGRKMEITEWPVGR
jgi:hypothetical protein